MVYVGGKKKLAKFICPIIQKELDTGKYEAYVEPFGGGGNIMEHINFPKKFFYDANKELVAFWKALQNGWKMPEPNSFGKEHYDEVKQSFKNKDGKYEDYYYGYMSIVPSYNGKVWGSFAKDGARLYQKEHYLSVINQLPKMQNVEFGCSLFNELSFENCVIYCDPPYKDSKKDYYNKNFNQEKFYDWCREMSTKNKIFISETQMPVDFIKIWEKEYKRTLANQTEGIKTAEKLFTI